MDLQRQLRQQEIVHLQQLQAVDRHQQLLQHPQTMMIIRDIMTTARRDTMTTTLIIRDIMTTTARRDTMTTTMTTRV
jgi:hypothetical protein